MDFIGEIVARADGKPIDQQAWIDLIDRHANLARPVPRTITNPFDRKPMTIRPRSDGARVVIGGKDVGTMDWFVDGENGINVFGDPDMVAPVAEEVAKALGAEFRRTRSEDA